MTSHSEREVSRVLAFSFGIPAFVISALAFLLLGYFLFLLFASGGPDEGTNPFVAAVGLTTFAISNANLVIATRFMAERRWRYLVYFVLLSVIALVLLALLWNAGA